VLAKFTQHAGRAEKLLGTGDAEIVEHRDSYWGDGGDGSGRNMLGRILRAFVVSAAGGNREQSATPSCSVSSRRWPLATVPARRRRDSGSRQHRLPGCSADALAVREELTAAGGFHIVTDVERPPVQAVT
jgi:hypothetical protein